ncbi:D-alanine--poly(phosphoribitol) ligase subunit 2 [Lachnospiraceae bacterium]|nr:D-alanine--poly(phosphoribitol) ligase subunit 2 [Lachnospiraceae bacterium]
MKDNLLEEIVNMITEINPYEEFDEDTLLFECDILDSLGLMQLVVNLEDTYSIRIDEMLITSENFRTVRHIGKLVDSLI